MEAENPTANTKSAAHTTPAGDLIGLGPALRRAWIGYQYRLDEALAELGFDERRLSDGRVLRLCASSPGATISGIGRELGITRQGASKVVDHLKDRGFVLVTDSATNGREKAVTLTSRGADFLAARQQESRTIENQLRVELGDAGFDALHQLLQAIGPDDGGRLRPYLQRSTLRVRPLGEE